MKKFTTLSLFLLLTFSIVIYSCQKGTDEVSPTTLELTQEADLITYASSEVIEGHYIVVFKDDAFPTLQGRSISTANYKTAKSDLEKEAKSLLETNRIAAKDIQHSYVKTIKGIALELTDTEVEQLRKDNRVDYIEQDQTVHVTMGGPPGGGGGGGDPPQSTPWGVTRVGGAMDGTNAGTAWIIDSGIDLDHPDLNVDVSRSQSFLSGGGGSSSPDDQNGHGSHVAGTVAAIDNGIGVVGVAAGATVVAVRVLDRRGSGSISGVIAGVDYVGANAASGDAANMSLGGGVSTALDNAVVDASSACPFALAAGNESDDANNHSPARANGNNIYTVSSMTSTDNWSSFSNYGNPPVDFCAPGSSIYSTYKNGDYATLSGTSMAAPHVCGILLIGGITSDGTVIGDPDGDPDDIAHH
ncbi:MAG: subtilisin family serine protease [Saprospiraceae bacterium]|jgi:subtilisin family serine protease